MKHEDHLGEIFVTAVVLGCLFMAFRRPTQPARLGIGMSYKPPEGPYDPDYGYREYESYFDGPEAKLYRHEYEAEQRRLGVIDNLLGSLTPADAEAELFTHWERDYFGLKAHKKRPAE